MAVEGKPHYRLGTQNMLELAKDDATKIPFETIFVVARQIGEAVELRNGTYVIRQSNGYDDPISVKMVNVADSGENHFMRASRLQPIL